MALGFYEIFKETNLENLKGVQPQGPMDNRKTWKAPSRAKMANISGNSQGKACLLSIKPMALAFYWEWSHKN